MHVLGCKVADYVVLYREKMMDKSLTWKMVHMRLKKNEDYCSKLQSEIATIYHGKFTSFVAQAGLAKSIGKPCDC